MFLKKDTIYSPYQYLKAFSPEKRKAFGLITEQQSVFVSRYEKEDHRDHIDFAREVHKAIFPSRSEDSFDDGIPSYVYLFIDDRGVLINLPEDGLLNELQFCFFCDFLEEISAYNREVENDDKVPIRVTINSCVYDFFDISEMKELLEDYYHNHERYDILIEDEEFIGKLVLENEFGGGFKI